MTDAARERLFGYQHAFDHPVTAWVTITVAAALVLAPLLTLALGAMGKLSGKTRRDIWIRYWTWLVLAPAMLIPVLLGAAWTVLLVLVASILCYREFARATGLFRETALSIIVVLAILTVALAAIDHWYALFAALPPLTLTFLAAVAVVADRPSGYIQRVALASTAFLLFGSGLGHLSYMTNEPDYRPLVLMLLLCVQLNDIFAYICGKAFGRRRLLPNTSPNKTLGGHLGALALTVPLACFLGSHVFAGSPLASPRHLIAIGLIISIGGQLGDLVLSSIKRDLGVKDLAHTLPGHGGFSDRFNNLLLVAPAVFHYIGYHVGFALDQPTKVFTFHGVGP